MTEFKQIVAALAAGLGGMEFWCVTHPDGDLDETASKDMTMPAQTFCEALGVDWADAVDQGYSLGKITLTTEQAAALPRERLFGCLVDFSEEQQSEMTSAVFEKCARCGGVQERIAELEAFADRAWKLSLAAQAEIDTGDLAEINGRLVEIAEAAAKVL